MKRRIFAVILLICVVLTMAGCSKTGGDSTFSIRFIDVGQGDCALIECDGHYMLIDGGDTSAGDKVYSVLVENDIKHLDILVASHLHADHIGGLIKALTYATKIDLTISNTDYSDTEVFRKFNHELSINGSSITVPDIGAVIV